MKANSMMFLLVVGAVIVVIALPSLLSGFADLIDRATDFVRHGFEDWEELDKDFDGHSTIGITLYYADGTERQFKVDDYSFIPLTIYDEFDMEIKQIEVHVWATLEHTFNQQGGFIFEVTDFDAYILDATSTKIGTLMENYETTWNSAQDWITGHDKNIKIKRWDASEIEALLTAQPIGEYSLALASAIKVTLLRDGVEPSKTAVGSASVVFQYGKAQAGEITSLRVTIGTYKLR